MRHLCHSCLHTFVPYLHYTSNNLVFKHAGKTVDLFVCPSECFIDRQQRRRPAGLLLSAVWAGDIDRQLLNAVQRALSSKRGQRHAVSRRTRLNHRLNGGSTLGPGAHRPRHIVAGPPPDLAGPQNVAMFSNLSVLLTHCGR